MKIKNKILLSALTSALLSSSVLGSGTVMTFDFGDTGQYPEFSLRHFNNENKDCNITIHSDNHNYRLYQDKDTSGGTEIKDVNDHYYIGEQNLTIVCPDVNQSFYINMYNLNNDDIKSNNRHAIPKKLLQWGDEGITLGSYALSGAKELVIDANDSVQRFNPEINSAFNNVKSIERLDINTSTLTQMYNLFTNVKNINIDVTNWDTSNVTGFGGIFKGAVNFNQDISAWDVSSANDMGYMFSGATNFNQDISAWDVSNVIYMNAMFQNATSFNQDISAWNVSNVTSMTGYYNSPYSRSGMFTGATSFNQDISGWDTSKVTKMQAMFYDATAFTYKDSIISAWDINQFAEETSRTINGVTITTDTREIFPEASIPTIELTVIPGSTNMSTKVISSESGLYKKYSSTSIDTPEINSTIDASADIYTSGTSISNVVVGGYLAIYKVDDHKVIGFKQTQLTVDMIKVPGPDTLDVVVEKGTTKNTTKITATGTLYIKESLTSISTPELNANISTIDGANTYTSGTDITPSNMNDITNLPYLAIYSVDAGVIKSFKLIKLTADMINIALVPDLDITITKGTLTMTSKVDVTTKDGGTLYKRYTPYSIAIPYDLNISLNPVITLNEYNATTYTSGDDIEGVQVEGYLSIYEIDSNSSIKYFKSIQLTANMIKDATPLAPKHIATIEFKPAIIVKDKEIKDVSTGATNLRKDKLGKKTIFSFDVEGTSTGIRTEITTPTISTYTDMPNNEGKQTTVIQDGDTNVTVEQYNNAIITLKIKKDTNNTAVINALVVGADVNVTDENSTVTFEPITGTTFLAFSNKLAKMQHIVKIGDVETKAISEVAGTIVNLNNESIETVVSDALSSTFKAMVVTKTDGTTITKFVTISDNGIESNPFLTLSDDSQFAKGSTSTIKLVDGKLVISTTTTLTDNLKIK